MSLTMSHFVLFFLSFLTFLNFFLTQVSRTIQLSPSTNLLIIVKKGNAKECSNYYTIALISHTSKVMLKILQARLQQYVNRELPDVQAGFFFFFFSEEARGGP